MKLCICTEDFHNYVFKVTNQACPSPLPPLDKQTRVYSGMAFYAIIEPTKLKKKTYQSMRCTLR